MQESSPSFRDPPTSSVEAWLLHLNVRQLSKNAFGVGGVFCDDRPEYYENMQIKKKNLLSRKVFVEFTKRSGVPSQFPSET